MMRAAEIPAGPTRAGRAGFSRLREGFARAQLTGPKLWHLGASRSAIRLYDELAIQRRDILASCLLAQPALALDYALFVMVDARVFAGGGFRCRPEIVSIWHHHALVPRRIPSRRICPAPAPGLRQKRMMAIDAGWCDHDQRNRSVRRVSRAR